MTFEEAVARIKPMMDEAFEPGTWSFCYAGEPLVVEIHDGEVSLDALVALNQVIATEAKDEPPISVVVKRSDDFLELIFTFEDYEWENE